MLHQPIVDWPVPFGERLMEQVRAGHQPTFQDFFSTIAAFFRDPAGHAARLLALASHGPETAAFVCRLHRSVLDQGLTGMHYTLGTAPGSVEELCSWLNEAHAAATRAVPVASLDGHLPLRDIDDFLVSPNV